MDTRWTSIADYANTCSSRTRSKALGPERIADATMLRGDERRNADLCDLYSLELDGSEGLTPAKAVILVSRQGKLNKCSRIEYGPVLRHRGPELCPVSSLFLYLF
ncbi:TPA: hypothetical protein N0F65_000554 [Lagenidium giganteum]|uniref:Ndc10 domain-containing protein n=1 Tax=Lagenidium giganteum TaxID=4803 RepID=A0AAV2Z2U1_9STRA|nr:TPA: hypothetical protein N0F65_000554 [Lagenidium giganteum]